MVEKASFYFFYPVQNIKDAKIPTKIRNGSTFNSKVMAQASPASPAPKRAKIPSTIRKVTSIEPRPYKYTYRKCQNMTNDCFDAFGPIFEY